MNKLLELTGIVVKEITVPVWETIYIKSFSACTRQQLFSVKENQYENLVLNSVCDSEGNLLFTQDDLQAIQKISYTILDPIVHSVLDLNGMKRTNIDDQKKS